MKTIFFVINSRTRVNFILRTDLFKILQKKKDFKIVIISPFSNDTSFLKEFGSDNVFFEQLKSLRGYPFKIVALRALALAKPLHPELKKSRMISAFMDRRFQKFPIWVLSLRHFFRDLILNILPKSISKSEKFWMKFLSFFISKKYGNWLFEKYSPNLVILANAGGDGYEIPFLVSAYFCKIPTVAVDANLDAATYRHFGTPFFVTKFCAFGEPQKKEFVEIHKFFPESTEVTGALRYDFYFKEFNPISREDFFKKVGADPTKKLITLGAKTSLVFPHNQDIIDIVQKEISNGLFGPAQLFVRFDPGHDTSIYGELLNKILWEKAENASDENHLPNLLYHSDVYLGLGATTLALEACAVDTPAVWIGFDGYTKYNDPKLSCRLQYDLAVFQRIIKSGGVPLVETPENLVSWIKENLENKEKNKEKRELLMKSEYFNFKDGLAGERIANLIINLLK